MNKRQNESNEPMLIERLDQFATETSALTIEPKNKHLIGDLEKYVGFEPKTIRFYERAGLLSPQRLGRFRVFEDTDIKKLQIIKYLRGIGMPLAKIKAVLAAQMPGANPDVANGEVRKLLEEQLAELKRKHAKLQENIAALIMLLPSSNGNGPHNT